MEIKTKYTIGSEFWVMQDNRPKMFRVDAIYISIHHRDIGNYQIQRIIDVRYECNQPMRVQVTESNFYPSKQALLATL
jgi:hypothetical protein